MEGQVGKMGKNYVWDKLPNLSLPQFPCLYMGK